MSAKNVFFDLDGTLHEGDMFARYIKFIAGKSFFKLLVLLPILAPALVLYALNPDRRWSLNLLLWPLTWMTTEVRLRRLEGEFVKKFKRDMCIFPDVRQALDRHLGKGDLVYVVSGSPEHLIHAVYGDLASLGNVHIIGSRMAKSAGAFLLKERCVCAEKPRMLKHRVGRLVDFESGYTDSKKDLPMLGLCAHKYRVSAGGVISLWIDCP